MVTYNGAAWIEACLKSLLVSTIIPKIVIVDNNSCDSTVKLVTSLFPEVKLFVNKRNIGFGSANNLGIRFALRAGADYVLLLNQDAKVDPAMIGLLVNLLNEYSDFGIVSPLHLDYQGTGIDPGFLTYIKNDVRLISDAFLGGLQELYEVPFVPAAVWLLTRQVLDEVGGFDPIFFMYGEDLDFCDRVRVRGFKIGLAPKALAYHWHHQCNGNLYLTFGTQCANLYAVLLYRLTRPDRRSFRNLSKVLLGWVRWSISNLLNLEFRKSFAMVLALFKVLINIFRIWQHHSQSDVVSHS